MCSGKPVQHNMLRTESWLILLRVFAFQETYHCNADMYCNHGFQALWEGRLQRGKKASKVPSYLTVSHTFG